MDDQQVIATKHCNDLEFETAIVVSNPRVTRILVNVRLGLDCVAGGHDVQRSTVPDPVSS
jgi:hypothetical protein